MELLSRSEVLRRTSLSQTTLWRKEKAGEFPKPARISRNRVAYDAEAVDAWIKSVLGTESSETAMEAQ